MEKDIQSTKVIIVAETDIYPPGCFNELPKDCEISPANKNFLMKIKIGEFDFPAISGDEYILVQGHWVHFREGVYKNKILPMFEQALGQAIEIIKNFASKLPGWKIEGLVLKIVRGIPFALIDEQEQYVTDLSLKL